MISLNWVKDYVDLEGVDLKDLATKITNTDINVEAVISNHIDNLVVGEVKECIEILELTLDKLSAVLQMLKLVLKLSLLYQDVFYQEILKLKLVL